MGKKELKNESSRITTLARYLQREFKRLLYKKIIKLIFHFSTKYKKIINKYSIKSMFYILSPQFNLNTWSNNGIDKINISKLNVAD